MQKLLIFTLFLVLGGCTNSGGLPDASSRVNTVIFDAGNGLGFKSMKLFKDVFCGIDTLNELHCYGNIDSVPQGKYASLVQTNNGVCAISDEGKLVCFNGVSSAVTSNIPDQIFTQVTIFDNPPAKAYACGITPSNRAVCWGEKTDFWENQNFWFDVPERNAPYQYKVFPGPYYKEIAVAEKYACGLSVDNEIFCWGGEYKRAKTPCPGSHQDHTGSGWSILVDLNNLMENVIVGGGSLGLIYLSCGPTFSGFWGMPKNIPMDMKFLSIKSFSGAALYLEDESGGISTFARREGDEYSPVVNSATWSKKYSDISVFGSTTCGVSIESGEIDCSGFYSDSKEEKRLVPQVVSGSPFKTVSANSDTICGLNKRGQAICTGTNLEIFDTVAKDNLSIIDVGSYNFEIEARSNTKLEIPHNAKGELSYKVEQISGPEVNFTSETANGGIHIQFIAPELSSCSTAKEKIVFDIEFVQPGQLNHSYVHVSVMAPWCQSDIPGLIQGETITSLSVDTSNKIWVGTSQGKFTYLSEDGWKKVKDSNLESGILGVIPSASGILSIMGESGDLLIINPDDFRQTYQNFISTRLSSLFYSKKEGIILFGGIDGLFASSRLDPTFKDLLSGLNISQIYAETKDELTVIGSRRLISLKPNFSQVELSGKNVDRFVVDEVANIIYAISSGILYSKKYDSDEAWVKYPHLNKQPIILAAGSPNLQGIWLLVNKNGQKSLAHVTSPLDEPEWAAQAFPYVDTPIKMVIERDNSVILSGSDQSLYIYKPE